MTDGSQEVVLSYFTGIADLPRKLLSLPEELAPLVHRRLYGWRVDNCLAR